MKIKNIIFKVENLKFSEALEYVIQNAQKTHSISSGQKGKSFIVTINPELVMIARKDHEYEKVLISADLALCDGVGIVWAGRIFGKKFEGRIHGVDLVEKISEAISDKPITIGLVGGRKNVAQLTSECLQKKYPGLKVSFAEEEWSDVKDPKSCDILFVAFGSPKQEKWIYEHLSKMDVKVAIGVGGAFDFISGNVRRAPVWIRKIGLEWLFRLITQPWRWKRQTALLKFIVEVLREKLVNKS